MGVFLVPLVAAHELFLKKAPRAFLSSTFQSQHDAKKQWLSAVRENDQKGNNQKSSQKAVKNGQIYAPNGQNSQGNGQDFSRNGHISWVSTNRRSAAGFVLFLLISRFLVSDSLIDSRLPGGIWECCLWYNIQSSTWVLLTTFFPRGFYAVLKRYSLNNIQTST